MSRWLAPIFVALTFLAILAIGFWKARNQLPSPKELARLVEAELTEIFGVPVKIESVQIGIRGAVVKNLRIQPDQRSPTGYTLTVPQLDFNWSLRQLFRPSQWEQFVREQIERALHQVIIANATLFLWRDKRGVWNIQPFFAQRKQAPTAWKVPTILIKDSTLVLGDETLPLPEGFPFRLKLVNVQGTIEPIELGTRITVTGQIAPPLGTGKSQVNLRIAQLGHETSSETHGRLIALNIRIAHLPERLQSFPEGRARLLGGTISTLVLNWHQTEETENISGAADLVNVPIALNFKKPFNLKPLQAFLSFAVNSQGGRVSNWHLTARTTKPHQNLGHGILTLEGSRKFLRIRWSGENFAVANLHLFLPTHLPIRSGSLKGSALFEIEGKGTKVDADLTIFSSQFHPTAELQKLNLPTFKIKRADAQIRLERIGRGWKGRLIFAARTEMGHGRAKVWLNGKEGKVEAELVNLRIEPFKAAVLNFVPAQFRNYAKISSGFVSGNFSFSWTGQRFRLEKMDGRLHQFALESEWSPPLLLSGQVQMDDEKIRLSKLKVRIDKNAVALLSGQTTVSKQPIWQVEGQLPSGAIEGLMAWAKAKWNLPFQLIRGGHAQVGAVGFGTQWQAQILWDEPSVTLNLNRLNLQGQMSRMSLLAAPQGAMATVNQIAVSPQKGRIAVGKSVWQFWDKVRFSQWRAVWDEKSRSLTAYGSVKVPQVEFDGLLVRDGNADLELVFSFADKPKFEFRALNLTANFPEGSLVDGQVRFISGSNQRLSASLKLRDFGLAQFAKALKKHSEIAFNFDGRFNGELIANAQIPSKVQFALSGEVAPIKFSEGEKSVLANKVILTALGVSAEGNGEKWQITQIAGEGIGREIAVSLNSKKLFAEFAQVQGLAKKLSGDWHWDLRVHKVRALNGILSGQGKGNFSCAEVNFSFSEIDVAQLSRLLDLSGNVDLPQGKSSGWLKASAEKRDEKWQGEWEGAVLLSEGKWRDWSVKMAGVRAQGQLLADERWNLQQLSGKFDGIHLLSEEGQAVLDGKFALRNGIGFVSLDGKWTGVSLRRLTKRFELPLQLQGLAEGTVQVLWEGNWQVSGTVKSQAVAVGESTIWRDVLGKWTWDGKKVELKGANANWNGGKLTLEGVIGTARNFPTYLTMQSKDISLSDLAILLREFQVPMSDWSWQGRVDGKIWLSGTNGSLRLTANLKGQRVRFGLAELGKVGFDFGLERNLKNGKVQLAGKGIVNIQHNGAVANAEIDSRNGEWRIRWRVGNVSIDTLKAIALEWRNRQGDKIGELDRWLRLPLKGNVSSEGYALFAENGVDEMSASIRFPNLRGIGEFIAQAELKVERKGDGWAIVLTELRQGNAFAVGSVKVGDDGKLSGEFEMNQVSSELLAGILALLGIETKGVPEGTLMAKIKLAGTLSEPVVEGNLRVSEVYWRGWLVRQIVAHRFEIRDGIFKVERGYGVIKWRTDAPLASFWGELELGGERRVDLQVEMPPTPLDAILPSDLPLQIQRGWLSGSMALQGKIQEPKLKGEIEIFAESVDLTPENSLPRFLEPLSTFSNIRCQVEAEGKVAKLRGIFAHWAGGSIEGSGWIELGEGGLQNLFANRGELTLKVQGASANLNGTNFNLRLAELKSQLSREGLKLSVAKLQGNGFEGKGDVLWRKIPKDIWDWLSTGFWNLALKFNDFRWQVRGAKGELSGSLALKSEGKNELPTLFGTLIVHDGDVLRLPVVATGGEGKWQLPSALNFSLRAEIGEKFFLRNPQTSLLLDGEIFLSGDLSQPRVEGEMRSQRGTLRLPAAVLTITEMGMRVAYSVDPLTKQWVGTARMRVEGETQLDIHRVLFTVAGPVDAQSQRLGILPSVTVMAIPPLPEQRALERMFGLGLAQLGEALTNWQQLFSGTLVQSFMGNLLAPLTEPLAQALRWTELSVIREQKTGRQWLRLGFLLAPRLHVLWRQGFSPADPSALEVQYYLGKRTSVTIIKRERERAEVRIQTSVRF